MPLWVWLNCRGSTQLLFLLQFSRNARKMQSIGTGFSHQQVTGMANDPAERDVVSLCYLGDSCVLFFGEGNTLPKFWFLKSTFRHRSTPGFRKHCIIIHHNGSLTSLKANEHSRTGSGTSHNPLMPLRNDCGEGRPIINRELRFWGRDGRFAALPQQGTRRVVDPA